MFRRIARTLALLPVAGLVSAQLILAPAAASAQPTGPVEDTAAPAVSASADGPVNSANARFVVDSYRTLLGREPDTDGLDYHLSLLAAGGETSRRAVATAMVRSTEGSSGEVSRAYADLLGRQPDGPGHSYWTDHLRLHDVVDLRVLILAGDEYRNRAGGTDEAWVESLYLEILGRTSDPSGFAYWVDQAANGTPRALIVAAVYRSDESLRRRTIVYYDEILDRAPTAAEQAAGAELIEAEGERALRARLVATDEAFEPFLQAALS